MLTENNVTLS